MSDLQFSDVSGTGAVNGGVQLWGTTNFTIESVYCSNFANTLMSKGYCLNLIGSDGTTFVTQYGSIINLTTSNTRYPVQTYGKTSSINLFGGDIECNLSSVGNGSVGIDLGMTHSNTLNNNGGEWGVFGTHVINCDTAIGIKSMAAVQDYAVLEQTGSYINNGDGVVIDVITGKGHTGATVVAGSMSQFNRGVVLNAGVDPVTILAGFNSVSTPFYGNVLLGAEDKALALIADSNIPIGAQIPTDLSFVREAAPSLSSSTTAKQYFDMTANVFKVSRNGGSFGFTPFVPSGGVTLAHLVQGGVTGTGDLSDSGLTVVTAGTAGTGPTNQGTSAALARSDHDHTAFQTLAWFFSGTLAGGNQPETLTLPEGVSNITITDFRVVADSPGASASTYNIQKCTSGCSGTTPVFGSLYSTNLNLAVNPRTAAKGSAPDNGLTFAAGNQLRVTTTVGGTPPSNVSVIMTFKCNTSN